MSEWKIVIEPKAADSPYGSITVDYRDDRESAEIDAEAFAEMIADHDCLPPSFDIHPDRRIPAAMIRKTGKAVWEIRADCFEFERDESYDDGYATLRVREA